PGWDPGGRGSGGLRGTRSKFVARPRAAACFTLTSQNAPAAPACGQLVRTPAAGAAGAAPGGGRQPLALTTPAGKLPSPSTVPPVPSMNPEPAGPKVGVPPALTPTKVMSLFRLAPTIARS